MAGSVSEKTDLRRKEMWLFFVRIVLSRLLLKVQHCQLSPPLFTIDIYTQVCGQSKLVLLIYCLYTSVLIEAVV